MSNFGVQTGTFWIDWSRGPVYGASVTLGSRTSNILIAIAGLWVGSLVAGWAWSITAALTYHYRQRTSLRDGVHVQHQLVWRNVGDPLTATSTNIGIYVHYLHRSETWEWLKGKARALLCCRRPGQQTPKASATKFPHLHRRTCLLAVPAPFIIWAGFFVAGVFVSYLASPTQDVRMIGDPERCGIWSFKNTSTSTVQNSYTRKVLQDTLAARSYARSCYPNNGTAADAISCPTYTKSSLLYFIEHNYGVCPFQSPRGESWDQSACVAEGSTNSIGLYTARLDSSNDLGINAPPAHSVGFQKTVNCSVLSWRGRNGNSSGLDTAANTTYTTYLFGTSRDGLGPNVTAWVNVADSQSNHMPYIVRAVYANAGSSQQVWTPAPPFNLPDGDVSLFFLISNSIVYEKPVYDPYFLAQDLMNAPLGLPVESEFYAPDNPVAVMGCVDRYIICDGGSEDARCTKSGGINSLPEKVEQLNLNVHQEVTALRLRSILANTDTYSSVYGTGTSALRASDTVLDVLSYGLPPNQWELEAEGWFQTSLAKMQSYATEFANNSGNLGPSGVISFPNSNQETLPIWHAQCHSQRIANSGRYQTFSFLGLLLTFCLGVTTCVVAKLLGCWIGRDATLEYQADDMFELQRMALNERLLSAPDDFPVYSPSSRMKHPGRGQGGLVTYLRPTAPAAQPIAAAPQVQSAPASQPLANAPGPTAAQAPSALSAPPTQASLTVPQASSAVQASSTAQAPSTAQAASTAQASTVTPQVPTATQATSATSNQATSAATQASPAHSTPLAAPAAST